MTKHFLLDVSPKHVGAVFLCSLLAAGLVAVVMALLGEYTKTRGRLLLTALSLGGFSLLSLTPVLLSRRPEGRWLGRAGLWLAVFGFVLVSTGIWGTPNSDAFWKGASIVSIWAVSLSHLSWLLMLDRGKALALWTWRVAVVSGGAVPLLAAVGILAEIRSAPYWWAVVLMILAQVACSLAAPALNWRGARTRRNLAGPDADDGVP